MGNLLDVRSSFEETLASCRELYRDSATICVEQHPNLLEQSPEQFEQLMDDLHRGLIIKTYVTVAQADLRWTEPEKKLANTMIWHVWRKRLEGKALRAACQRIFEDASGMTWMSMLRPFLSLEPLRDRIADVETLVMRMGNLVAKCDGAASTGEEAALREIQREIHQIFDIRSEATPSRPDHKSQRSLQQDWQQMQQDAGELHQKHRLPASEDRSQRPSPLASPQASSSAASSDRRETSAKPAADENNLEQALEDLRRLIGMENIKHEVESLTNYLKIQQERKRLGLATTDLSLHMVFYGNPGTGKTTVARIVGRIFGAMGILEKGHVVETDRSGLVAEFAGQTGPKTNRRIDEALGGVLFIDEAYSLVSGGNEDAYGREAVQTLLKRMEDDRKELVVVLAGYPAPMKDLLATNPGLQSRFNQHLTFEDFQPDELGRILECMCQASHYELPALTRGRLMLGLSWLYENRDEHFGNGRLARNLFEQAIRRLANRIAGVSELTRDLLTVIEPLDFDFRQVPSSFLEQDPQQLKVKLECPACHQLRGLKLAALGRQVTCPDCGHRFPAAWGRMDP